MFQTFNELLKTHMNEAEVLAMVSKSQEFEQVKVCVFSCELLYSLGYPCKTPGYSCNL